MQSGDPGLLTETLLAEFAAQEREKEQEALEEIFAKHGEKLQTTLEERDYVFCSLQGQNLLSFLNVFNVLNKFFPPPVKESKHNAQLSPSPSSSGHVIELLFRKDGLQQKLITDKKTTMKRSSVSWHKENWQAQFFAIYNLECLEICLNINIKDFVAKLGNTAGKPKSVCDVLYVVASNAGISLYGCTPQSKASFEFCPHIPPPPSTSSTVVPMSVTSFSQAESLQEDVEAPIVSARLDTSAFLANLLMYNKQTEKSLKIYLRYNSNLPAKLSMSPTEEAFHQGSVSEISLKNVKIRNCDPLICEGYFSLPFLITLCRSDPLPLFVGFHPAFLQFQTHFPEMCMSGTPNSYLQVILVPLTIPKKSTFPSPVEVETQSCSVSTSASFTQNHPERETNQIQLKSISQNSL